jgi:hypothetical protein
MRHPLGAYMQVYKNDGKAEFALKNFRKFYPDSPVYLVSDKGDDFSEIAKKYRCQYEHSSINVGIRDDGLTVEEASEWLERLRKCFLFCNADNILYMEDDVYVRGKIEINTSHILSGFYAHRIHWRLVQYVSEKYPKTNFNSRAYGACGGAIYNSDAFLKEFEQMKKFIHEDLDYIKKNIWYKTSFVDSLPCIMFMAFGYPYSLNENLTQPRYDKAGWETSNKPLVHIGDDGIQQYIMKKS